MGAYKPRLGSLPQFSLLLTYLLDSKNDGWEGPKSWDT